MEPSNPRVQDFPKSEQSGVSNAPPDERPQQQNGSSGDFSQSPAFLSALCKSTETLLGETIGKLTEANAKQILYSQQYGLLSKQLAESQAIIQGLKSKLERAENGKDCALAALRKKHEEDIQNLRRKVEGEAAQRRNVEAALSKAYKDLAQEKAAKEEALTKKKETRKRARRKSSSTKEELDSLRTS